MALVNYRVDSHIAVVALNDDENRFNPAFVDAFLGALDDIENETAATSVVVYSTHEKIFSNGIDLNWLLDTLQQGDHDRVKRFFYQLNALFKRLVTYPLVTIAAISGHAFAAGAILCCAFDFRFMRSDRGYFCLPEIDLGMPFFPGMNALLRSTLPDTVLRELQLTGLRLTAEMCLAHQVVKKAVHMDRLMDETLGFARQIDKQRPVIKEMKVRLNKTIVRAIEVDDPPYIESGQYQFGSLS